MPMTAFIGVRISWLMRARKSPLASFDASAVSLARIRASSAILRSVTSDAMPNVQRAPSGRTNARVVTSSQSVRPSASTERSSDMARSVPTGTSSPVMALARRLPGNSPGRLPMSSGSGTPVARTIASFASR